MLYRALDVKERLIKFVRERQADNNAPWCPQDDRLLAKDWVYINRLRMALRAFEDATIHTQGYRPWLSDWFITLHMLISKINDWKVDVIEVQGDNALATAFTTSWNKLKKYYQLVDETPIYYAAILLHPKLKQQKLREMWNTVETTPWIQPTIDKVRALWKQQYKPRSEATATSTHVRLEDEDNDSFGRRLATAKRRCITAPSTEVVDAFESFLLTDPEPCEDDNFDVLL